MANVEDKTKCARLCSVDTLGRFRIEGVVHYNEAVQAYVYSVEIDYNELFRMRGFIGYGIETEILRWLLKNHIDLVHVHRLPPYEIVQSISAQKFVTHGHQFYDRGKQYTAVQIFEAVPFSPQGYVIPQCVRSIQFDCSHVRDRVEGNTLPVTSTNMDEETKVVDAPEVAPEQPEVAEEVVAEDPATPEVAE